VSKAKGPSLPHIAVQEVGMPKNLGKRLPNDNESKQSASNNGNLPASQHASRSYGPGYGGGEDIVSASAPVE
jgi:hypothetical protein